MTPANPYEAVSSTAAFRGPRVGRPGTLPEPLATGILAALADQLDKLGNEKASRVRDLLGRKQ